MSKEKVKDYTSDIILKPPENKKKTSGQYIKEINKNPEKFGIKQSHVNAVDNLIKKADKILDDYDKPKSEKPSLAIGVYTRAKARLCKVVTINGDDIEVQFTSGKTKIYNIKDVKVYTDQDKAKKKFRKEDKTIKVVEEEEEVIEETTEVIEDTCITATKEDDPWSDF